MDNTGEIRKPVPSESTMITRRHTSYDQFDQEHPAFGTDGTIELKTHVALEDNVHGDKHRLIESYSPTDYVSMLIVTDKEEDAAIVAKTLDGRIIVAVADGVSRCALPKVASRTAVESAVRFLKEGRPLHLLFGAVSAKLNSLKLIPMVDDIIAAWKETQARTGSRIVQGMGEDFEKYKTRGHISSTTLAVIDYDRKNSRASLAARGDTRVIILRTDTEPEVIFDPKNNQIVYTGQASAMYSARSDIIKMGVPLSDGDVILVCTDGIFDLPDALLKIRQKVDTARQNNKSLPANQQIRLEYAAVDAVGEIVKAGRGVPDDITMVAIEHKTPQNTTHRV